MRSRPPVLRKPFISSSNFKQQHLNLVFLPSLSDSAVTSATTAAQSGLSSAGDGIKTIAAALISGQTAPASARDQVGAGLTAAGTALNGINS